jgi:K+-transporting ATPase ATPase A chain
LPPFYNVTTALAMLAGRFAPATLPLFQASRFAVQGRKAATIGTLSSDTVTFGVLTLAVVVLVGALLFCPPWHGAR